MRKTLGILPSASLETVTMISSAHNKHIICTCSAHPHPRRRGPPAWPRMLYRVHMVTYVRRRYGDPYRALSRSFVDEPPFHSHCLRRVESNSIHRQSFQFTLAREGAKKGSGARAEGYCPRPAVALNTTAPWTSRSTGRPSGSGSRSCTRAGRYVHHPAARRCRRHSRAMALLVGASARERQSSAPCLP